MLDYVSVEFLARRGLIWGNSRFDEGILQRVDMTLNGACSNEDGSESRSEEVFGEVHFDWCLVRLEVEVDW